MILTIGYCDIATGKMAQIKAPASECSLLIQNGWSTLQNTLNIIVQKRHCPVPEPSEVAIVCLILGYQDETHYDCLIKNCSIYDQINRFADPQIPLIIWHEGNISPIDQKHILQFERNAHVAFVDVSSCFPYFHGDNDPVAELEITRRSLGAGTAQAIDLDGLQL